MARSAREKQARVILCSPVTHEKFDHEGKFVHYWAGWREWVAACATAEKAAFLVPADLIGREYVKVEPATVEGFFDDKGTHTNTAGSMFNAKTVVSSLRAIPTAPLDAYLNEAGKQNP